MDRFCYTNFNLYLKKIAITTAINSNTMDIIKATNRNIDLKNQMYL
jgi:hypothetical protein